MATRKKQSGAGAAGLLTTTAQTIGSTFGKLAAKAGLAKPLPAKARKKVAAKAKKVGVAKGRK